MSKAHFIHFNGIKKAMVLGSDEFAKSELARLQREWDEAHPIPPQEKRWSNWSLTSVPLLTEPSATFVLNVNFVPENHAGK